jgi:hypothetical protein
MQHSEIVIQNKILIQGSNFGNIRSGDLLCVTVSCNGKSFRFIRPAKTDICRLIDSLVDKGKPMWITVYPHEQLSAFEILQHNRVGNVFSMIYI